MPKGVEHSFWLSASAMYVMEIPYGMPKGVEHTTFSGALIALITGNFLWDAERR